MTSLPTTEMPTGARPTAEGPFWASGDAISWRYRRNSGWRPGHPEGIFPMRVVQDDAAGVVAWLAPGSACLAARYPDGSDGHSGPLDQRFLRSHELVQARVLWRGAGTVRIALAGKPWSVWVFQDEAGDFAGWYINLENPCYRYGSDLFTSDHILDLWIEPDGTIQMKDEDELQAATEQGRLTGEQADEIRGHGEAARASFLAGDWPFAWEWTTWRPDPAWTVPPIPETATWTLDLTTA